MKTKKLRTFSVEVTYRNSEGHNLEETFPVTGEDYESAKDLAFLYTVEVLKLQDFELRIAGA